LLTHVSLFTGIGGIDLAAEWAGFKTICFVEKDEYCQKVLRKHWSDVPIIKDVKNVTREKIMAYAERNSVRVGLCAAGAAGKRWGRFSDGGQSITLVSGGFPCQPHSVAGKHQGSADERNLWPEFRRIIGEIKPRWVLGENVSGIFSSDAGRFFGTILSDLAEMGYSAGWGTYGAVDVGALHRRKRVFIVAHAVGRGEQQPEGLIGEVGGWISYGSQDVGYSESGRQQEQRFAIAAKTAWPSPECSGWWSTEPDVGRVANGIPFRVDRLRCLGNAVVPQQVYPILKAIAEIEQINSS